MTSSGSQKTLACHIPNPSASQKLKMLYVDASKAAKNPELTVGAGKFLFGIFGKK
jgi:hypothetical protein